MGSLKKRRKTKNQQAQAEETPAQEPSQEAPALQVLIPPGIPTVLQYLGFSEAGGARATGFFCWNHFTGNAASFRSRIQSSPA